MFQNFRSTVSLILLILYIFHQIICEDNIARSLSCLSENTFLKYEHFEINLYFSSRKHQHRLLTSETIVSGELDIDPTRRMIVIVHGFRPRSYMNLMSDFRDAFLTWDDVNVIYVDWKDGCNKVMNYTQAARNTEYTAIIIKNLFNNLIETWKGTNKSAEYWGPLHFIGFSLGAHVVGQAAELLKVEGNQPFVHRITGLDPAEPCFDDTDSPLRLKKSSAHFVDVIHTDGAQGLNSRFGSLEPMGHVDFYVNGGSIQPGCNLFRYKRNIKYLQLAYHFFVENGGCHHFRSIILFIQSLKQTAPKQCRFWAYPWDLEKIHSSLSPNEIKQCDETKCIEMGINAELYNHSTNVYYVATTGEPPYCQV